MLKVLGEEDLQIKPDSNFFQEVFSSHIGKTLIHGVDVNNESGVVTGTDDQEQAEMDEQAFIIEQRVSSKGTIKHSSSDSKKNMTGGSAQDSG